MVIFVKRKTESSEIRERFLKVLIYNLFNVLRILAGTKRMDIKG